MSAIVLAMLTTRPIESSKDTFLRNTFLLVRTLCLFGMHLISELGIFKQFCNTVAFCYSEATLCYLYLLAFSY